jgi:CTP synthase (UTP-ammonia lyase)
MPSTFRIGLIGDFDATVTAHRAIPPAISLAGAATGVAVAAEWLPTERIRSPADLLGYDGLWCVPASPYRSTEGALTAIRHAREKPVPFLATCGGFQHAILEYARNVLGWADASHGETDPDRGRVVIAPLSCPLVEVAERVTFVPGSRFALAYGSTAATEGYHCRYGLNPAFAKDLFAGPLRPTAFAADNEVRGVELDDHPFFVGCLFQPERAALEQRVPPIVAALVTAVAGRK